MFTLKWYKTGRKWRRQLLACRVWTQLSKEEKLKKAGEQQQQANSLEGKDSTGDGRTEGKGS